MHSPSDDPLTMERQILTLASQLNVTEYHLLKHLDAFDEIGGWKGDGIRSFAHWLNWKAGMGSVMAREKLRVARALRELPQIDSAFASGHVSYTKVRAMTRIATPANESFLLQIAEFGTAQQLELLVRKFRSFKQRESDQKPGQKEKMKPSCSWFEDDDEMVTFKICLPKDEALAVIDAIDRIADQLYTPEANKENVSAETVCQDDRPDRSECRARAVALLAGPESSAPDLMLHLQANPDHADYKINQGPLAYDDNNIALSPKTLRRLACDCRVAVVNEDKEGHILDIGRKSRVIPPSLRRVLAQRDSGCRFPGCTQHKWTDAHHIKHWIDGGETNLNNLVTLCRYHHTRLHQGHFAIEHGGQSLRFKTVQGRVMPPVFFPQFKPESPVPLQGELIASNWQGDSLDVDHALWILDDITE